MRFSGDTDTLRKLYSPETDEFFVTLLSLYSEDFGETPGNTLRFSTSYETYTAFAEDWMPYPFEVRPPPEQDRSVSGRAELVIDTLGLDGRIMREIDRVTEAIIANFHVMKFSDPSTAIWESAPPGLKWKTTSGENDLTTIAGELAPSEDLANTAFPWGTFNPSWFPGISGALSA